MSRRGSRTGSGMLFPERAGGRRGGRPDAIGIRGTGFTQDDPPVGGRVREASTASWQRTQDREIR